MRPITRGPWTITIGAEDGTTYKVHHRRNYIPEEHSMHDLIQLSRLIRLCEKWDARSHGERVSRDKTGAPAAKPTGLCRCNNGHAWKARVTALGDDGGIKIPHVHWNCPSCGEMFTAAAEGRYLTACETCDGDGYAPSTTGMRPWMDCVDCRGTGAKEGAK